VVRQLGRGGVTGALAAGRIGGLAVLGSTLSAVAPFTMVAGLGVVGLSTTGNLALPLGYVIVAVLLGVFSTGYVTLSRHLPHAGAFYSQAAAGLGPSVGVASAWVALLAYDALQVALFGIVGSAAVPLVQDWTGLTPPWWLVAYAAWALVAVLGVSRVEVSARVLQVLLTCEVLVLIVYDVTWLTHPAHPGGPGGGIAWTMLDPSRVSWGSMGPVLAIAVLGFIGFETAVVLSEEVRDHARTIPRATYAAVGFVAVLIGGSILAVGTATGPDAVVARAGKEGPDLVFTLAADHLGSGAATVGRVLFLTSVLAALASFHVTTSRYVFALGREGALPVRLGRASTHGAPRAASLTQSTLAFAVITVFTVAGWDPLTNLFYIGGTSGALGILVLLPVGSLAVLGFFTDDRRGETLWRTRVAPLLSLTGLLVVLGLVVWHFAALLGVPDDSPLRWGVPALYAVVLAAGLGYGRWLKTARPSVYAAIGHGAHAALLPTTGTWTPPELQTGLTANGPLPGDHPPTGGGLPAVLAAGLRDPYRLDGSTGLAGARPGEEPTR